MGKLADGTGFTASALIVGGGSAGNQFRLINPTIYSGKGFLGGNVVFSSSVAGTDCAGLIRWIKPEMRSAKFYPAGFQTAVELNGALYTAPLPGKRALPFAPKENNGTLEFSDGSLRDPIIETVTLSLLNTVSITAPNSANINVTIKAPSGFIKGSFIHPANGKMTVFGGVLFQHPDAPKAGGFFLGPILSETGLSGDVRMSPSTP